MDTLTHSLVGLTAAKAGLEKLSPATTICCLLAANAPDIDFVSGIFGDRWTLLHYHRGRTHSLVGTLGLALLIPSLFWLGDGIVSSWRQRARVVRFRGLLLACLIVAATHPLMDWTNNYGVRPLLPWSGRWFYGDLVYIVDPFLWMTLGAGAFLLTSDSKRQTRAWLVLGAIGTCLVGLAAVVGRRFDHPLVVVGLWILLLITCVVVRRFGFRRHYGRRLALTSLALVAVYWGGLAALHSRAVGAVRRLGPDLRIDHLEKVTQTAAMPTLANPSHWLGIVETDRAIYRFDLFLSDPARQPLNLRRFAKPEGTEAAVLAAVRQDRRVQILFEFSRFPIGRLVDHDCLTETLVQFSDLRYTEPGQARGNFSIELPVACPHQP